MTDLDTTPTDLAGLANDIDVTRKELGRADGKAGHLLTLAVGGTALLLGLHAGQHMPLVCRWAALTAGVLAVVTLCAVLWPRTGGRRTGYLAHGNRTPTQIVAVQPPPRPPRWTWRGWPGTCPGWPPRSSG